ncbi:hypothetical protein ABVK25_004581 [Lepraria finkii]|uniref:Uncharacterized protein n=1 Tax=Lepraria finkii TaxID=1340010 RepID=A0ABR4BBL6_9LECA
MRRTLTTQIPQVFSISHATPIISPINSPIQYVVEPITTAGSLLSTETTFGVGDPTETFAVVEPTPIITTIISGSLAFTSKMAGAGGQPTVTVVLPANYGLVNSFYNNPYNLYSNNFDPGYF